MQKRTYRFLTAIFSFILALSAVALLFTATANYDVTNDHGAITAFADEPETNLPSAVTLVGSPYIPPIDNQGQVGSCASESSAYMQLTNAVSRYIEAYCSKVNWGNPSSGNENYIFSPKFTYTLGGSFPYDILKDHGALTLDKSIF